MTYAPVNGLQLYYEVRGSGRPLVLLHGGLMTIDLNFGPMLEPLAAGRQVIAVELQGHGHTADSSREMTIEALAGDVIALLDHLGIAEADFFGFSLGGLVTYAIAFSAPARVGKIMVASADGHRPPGRESAPLGEDLLPTAADFQAMRDAYAAVAPDPAHFDEFAAGASAMVHKFAGWTAAELRSLRVPTLLIFGDRDFSPLADVLELFGFLPDAQLAVLPGTTHMDVARRPAQLLALITQFLDVAAAGALPAFRRSERGEPGQGPADHVLLGGEAVRLGLGDFDVHGDARRRPAVERRKAPLEDQVRDQAGDRHPGSAHA
jgi:pimeloyl-ACP methyl ester carboxylesterase